MLSNDMSIPCKYITKDLLNIIEFFSSEKSTFLTNKGHFNKFCLLFLMIGIFFKLLFLFFKIKIILPDVDEYSRLFC